MPRGQIKQTVQENNQVELKADNILMAEYNYARETAAQAMDDRHKMVNYYLIIVGLIINAFIGLLKTDVAKNESILSVSLQNSLLFVLLFLLFLIGVLYLYKIIRLRQAWFDSVTCMNRIKDYYHIYLKEYALKEKAFLWTSESLKKKKLNTFNTIFFYSALLIIIIDSMAFLGAFVIIKVPLNYSAPGSLLFFIFQISSYRINLRMIKEKL